MAQVKVCFICDLLLNLAMVSGGSYGLSLKPILVNQICLVVERAHSLIIGTHLGCLNW